MADSEPLLFSAQTDFFPENQNKTNINIESSETKANKKTQQDIRSTSIAKHLFSAFNFAVNLVHVCRLTSATGGV